MELLYDMAAAETVPVLPVSVAFQAPVTACPEGRVNRSVQPLIGVEDALVIVALTVNPPCHGFGAKATLQEAGGGVVVGVMPGDDVVGVMLGLVGGGLVTVPDVVTVVVPDAAPLVPVESTALT